MQARLIAYPPDNAALIRLIRPDAVLRIGRVRECGPVSDQSASGQPAAEQPASEQLVLDHPSISRVHAELHGDGGHWRLLDMGSKNGTHVDGIAIKDARLQGASWLRFGDVYCEFAPLSQAEAEAGERDRHARRHAATAHTVRIEKLTRLDDLLDASLRAVLELAQCERGFVLLNGGLGKDAGFAVRASLSIDPAALATRAFSGSVGAVRRALDQKRAVVANDIGNEAWLATRHSVVAAGLSALVCLPLLDDDRVLGAIYADRVAPGPAISTLDLELLEAFAENAAVWIAARRTSEQLDAQVASSKRNHADLRPADSNRADSNRADSNRADPSRADSSHADWNRIVAAHAGDA